MRYRTLSIRRFLFGHYFSDGIRITLGVLLPSLVFSQINRFDIGVTVSLGALCVSVADNPGPLVHKRNGMLFCNLFIFLVSLSMGLINRNPFAVGLAITVFSFFFSMFAVYGNRATSIGAAVLVVMVLSMDKKYPPLEALNHALLILGGGFWYIFLSLSSFQILPYRPAQQTLGDCIVQVAKFMRIKARFYGKNADFDREYRRLIDQQIIVNQEQDAVREMLFKSRMMIKETTRMGRIMVLTFVDVVDLFEQIMATHYDYKSIHDRYDGTDILAQIGNVIHCFADALDNIGLAVLSNSGYRKQVNGLEMLEHLRESIDKISTPDAKDSNLVLKRILVNLRNINQRISAIQSYFDSKDLTEKGPLNEQLELSRFVSHQDYDWRSFRNNLNWHSATFRHALRVALVGLIGFLISRLFINGNHSYWILLTILVVLKPGFSLSKERSYQRLIGTVAGGAIGFLVLYFVHDKHVLFVLLLIFMVGAYSFQRYNYITSVVFMTPYILILFSFLGSGSINILQERIVDTLIGSGIAFLAIYIVFPNWESEQVKQNMTEVLRANFKYLQVLADMLTGRQPGWADYRLARKDVYVSSANLAAAFQRMISEPKSKQKKTREVQEFVVLNHILSSYIANMTTVKLSGQREKLTNEQTRVLKRALHALAEATRKIDKGFEVNTPPVEETTITENRSVENVEDKHLFEQVNFIYKISSDIARITDQLVAA